MKRSLELADKIGAHEVHSAATIFPSFDSNSLASLTNDIREHGLREDIVLFEGKVLDGRHRYRACLIAQVEPRFVNWSGGDPISYVVSRNLHRRHLSESQRAMIAARAKGMFETAARERMRAGVANPSANWREGGKASEKAAEFLNVSTRSVERASMVLKNGSPGVVAAVDRGEVAVSAAAANSGAVVTKHNRVGKILRLISRLTPAELKELKDKLSFAFEFGGES